MNELTAIKKGDESAFIQVYYQYHQKVFRFFLKRVGFHETARELTQDSFVKLWKSRHTLSAVHTIETQLFTIAGTMLIDHYRRRTREKQRLIYLNDIPGTDNLPAYSTADRQLESSSHLEAVVRDLPPARKKVILLKIASGYSNKQIASHLSVSEKTVEDHVTKALRHIRSLFAIFFL